MEAMALLTLALMFRIFGLQQIVLNAKPDQTIQWFISIDEDIC
jgi:hypothetical protein